MSSEVLSPSLVETQRYRLIPPARLRSWKQLRESGMVRIAQAEFLCECGRWHAIKIAKQSKNIAQQTTGEELVVLAARKARMCGCPKGKPAKWRPT